MPPELDRIKELALYKVVSVNWKLMIIDIGVLKYSLTEQQIRQLRKTYAAEIVEKQAKIKVFRF